MKHNVLAHSVRLAILSTPVILTGLISSAQASGPCSASDSMTYVCSGSATTGVNLSGSSLNVSTAPGFQVDTTDAKAIELNNQGGNLIFKDENQSKISGAETGLSAINGNSTTDLMISTSGPINGNVSAIATQNNGSGETVIETKGTVNSANIGINAVNGSNAKGLTITADEELGTGLDAISATNEGSGATSITTLGKIGSGRNGIFAINGTSATDMLINSSGDIGVGGDAIKITNNGSGATTVTTSGTVTGAHGIYAVNGSNAKDMTINVHGDLSSWGDAIYAENNGSGKTIITNSGTGIIKGPSYGHAIIVAGRASSITNSGNIIGKVQLGDEGNTVTNNVDGTWDLSGNESIFGAGTNSLINAGTLITANASSTDDTRTTKLSNVGTLTHSGTLTMANGHAGEITVIDGNYIGNGGKLVFDTVLGGDNSATDQLIINGNTSGTSSVQVNNLGGTGAQTLNGIELISVKGKSDGTFTQEGRIAAGAYDYLLVRGKGSKAGNWYLSNWQGPDNVVETLRPESGAYTANLAAANNLFTTRFHDLIGATQYTDLLTGEKKMTSMWVRNEGGHNRSRDSSGQLKTQANRYVLQIGGDITQWTSNGDDRYHIGVMAGYGNSKSKTVSDVNGYRADGSVDGYSTGMYAAWYASDADKAGAYASSSAQYSWFKNRVSSEGTSTEKYNSQGVTASAEGGYAFRFGQTKDRLQSYFIQPKAMVTWMGVKADKHTELNGTEISGEGDGNVQTRLGVKTYIRDNIKTDGGQGSNFQKFAEVNWVHNTHDFASRMDGIEVKQDGAINLAEMKVGVEGQFNKQFGLWGNVALQFGDKGYSDTSAMLGGKYSF